MPRTAGDLQVCAKTWALSTYRCCITPKFAGYRGERCCNSFTNLKQKSQPSFQRITRLFDEVIWLARVAYVADVFEHLNTLNMSMPGRGYNIFEQYDKIAAFKKKDRIMGKDRLDMFPKACHEAQQLDYGQRQT